MNLSPNFSAAELVESDTATRLGLDNRPGYAEMGNLYLLAERLESIRSALGDVPILVSSAYRSPKLNAAVKGSPRSAHLQGLAADFRAPAFGTPRNVAGFLADPKRMRDLQIDQLIFEGTWVHVAFRAPEDGQPRGEVLSANFTPSGTQYVRGIT
jgi:hypothetical protein